MAQVREIDLWKDVVKVAGGFMEECGTDGEGGRRTVVVEGGNRDRMYLLEYVPWAVSQSLVPELSIRGLVLDAHSMPSGMLDSIRLTKEGNKIWRETPGTEVSRFSKDAVGGLVKDLERGFVVEPGRYIALESMYRDTQG